MNRQAQAVVLLLLGGAVVRASVTDLYLRYVKEGLRPFLIAAGLLLIVAAVMTCGTSCARPPGWPSRRGARTWPVTCRRAARGTPGTDPPWPGRSTTGTATVTTSRGSAGC